jgi:hypothetical protein
MIETLFNKDVTKVTLSPSQFRDLWDDKDFQELADELDDTHKGMEMRTLRFLHIPTQTYWEAGYDCHEDEGMNPNNWDIEVFQVEPYEIVITKFRPIQQKA